MKHLHFRPWLIALLALLSSSLRLSAQDGASAAARARLSHLRHGVNASEWFAQVYDGRGYTAEHFANWTTPEDIALIAAMGFDHVRISVNPQPMFRSGHADELPADYLAYLDTAVSTVLAHHLAVVIDLHPESDFKSKLASNDAFVEQFADFWRSLARHYSRFDPERVFFEVLNEPEIHDRYRWSGIQAKLAAAIREGAPEHTIVATGALYSADDELVALEPLADRNVIYAFHFYEPHIFTHQGATWGVNFWHWERMLAYPSSPESAQKVAAQVPDRVNRLYVLRYGMEHWNAARIDMEIAQVAEWAKHWKVAVLCDEFGVYAKYADPADRLRWLEDARRSFERYGMGWTVWDYSGAFGVVSKAGGHATPDSGAVRALGLQAPSTP